MDVSEREIPQSLKTVLAEKFPHLDESLTGLIIKYSDIFNVSFVKERGYKSYLNSLDCIHQFFGACALLEKRVEEGDLEERHLNEIKGAFEKASESRRIEALETNSDPTFDESDEIEQLSKHVELLADIYRELKG